MMLKTSSLPVLFAVVVIAKLCSGETCDQESTEAGISERNSRIRDVVAETYRDTNEEPPPETARTYSSASASGRERRDMSEIIYAEEKEKTMYAPNVMVRTKVALNLLQKLLKDFAKVIADSKCVSGNTTTTAVTTMATTTTKPTTKAKKASSDLKSRVLNPLQYHALEEKEVGVSFMVTYQEQRDVEDAVIKSKNFSMDLTMDALKDIFNSSEYVMLDQLSAKMVIRLENGTRNVMKIIKYYPNKTEMDTTNLTQLLAMTILSTKHAYSRVEDHSRTHYIIGSLGSITVLITTGFVLLAILCTLWLIHRGFKSNKPGYGIYDVDQTYENHRNGTAGGPRTPTPGSKQIPSMFSSPARAAVITRSNPIYSSQRSVDRPASSTPSGYSYDADPNVSALHSLPLPKPSKRRVSYDIPLDRNSPDEENDPSKLDYKDPRRQRDGVDNAAYAPEADGRTIM